MGLQEGGVGPCRRRAVLVSSAHLQCTVEGCEETARGWCGGVQLGAGGHVN